MLCRLHTTGRLKQNIRRAARPARRRCRRLLDLPRPDTRSTAAFKRRSCRDRKDGEARICQLADQFWAAIKEGNESIELSAGRLYRAGACTPPGSTLLWQSFYQARGDLIITVRYNPAPNLPFNLDPTRDGPNLAPRSHGRGKTLVIDIDLRSQ
jgi:hypothetical protein